MKSERTTNSDWCAPLYEQKATQLVLYGRALGLSHSESEDVLQETFVALLKLEEIPESPPHYAVRTFRNRALNFRRSLWTRIRNELESKRWFERSGGETPCERDAMRSLEQLPREQREVIVLKFWHHHTFEEIGRILNVSPNTIAGRYRYGLQKIRNQLAQHEFKKRESTQATDAVLDTASAFARA